MRYSFLALFLLPLTMQAQLHRLGENVFYRTTAQGSVAGGDKAPFWFTNNRYGLGTPNRNSMLVRAMVGRDLQTDSLRNWRVGYGAELVGAAGMNSHFVLQQLYTDIQWKNLRLSLGQLERPLEHHHPLLSSGALTSGINARPIPQLRISVPDFLAVPGTRGWLSFKGHLAFGIYTDNRWQRHFTRSTQSLRSANSLYHSKELVLRVGNESKFPLSASVGLEMSTQFGGEAWNVGGMGASGEVESYQRMGWSLRRFWNAFIPGGSDPNDGSFPNKEGNQLGSWNFHLDYKGSNWNMRAYLEHFFEDESQMVWEYGWKDMLYGLELTFPQNPFVTTAVYEYLNTMDQSGPVYHDATPLLPEQISACDDYYNHHIYGGWQHAGFSMGHGFLFSPIYNDRGQITFMCNRVKAHHIGLMGSPLPALSYRFLYSHLLGYGRYFAPYDSPRKADFLLLEATYKLKRVPGLSVTGSYGMNAGSLLGDSQGMMLGISYVGLFNKKPAR